MGRDVVRAGEEPAVAAEDLPVEGHLVADHRGARPHGAQERRVGAPDGVAVQVGGGVGVEPVEELLVVDAAHEADPLVALGGVPDLLDVAGGVRRGADDHERQSRGAGAVSADDLEHVVLRLEPGDDEVVAVGREVHLGQAVRRRLIEDRRAVPDELRGHVELVAVVVGDAGGVGDERVGGADAELLGPAIVRLAAGSPLRPTPLQTVHVQGDGRPAQPEQREERRVRGVEHEGRVGAAVEEQVQGRQPGVAEGLDLLHGDRGEVHHAHAEVFLLAVLGAAGVHDDVVAPVGEPSSHLFDGRLESAVGRRHAAGPHHRDREGCRGAHPLSMPRSAAP